MPTPHIESNLNEIASIVLMPGDPNRAKYIADNYLKNVNIVNKVRGMIAYTGEYEGKKITIFTYVPNKKSTRKKQGHRQPYTKIEIKKIK